jgi:hypothetical protein
MSPRRRAFAVAALGAAAVIWIGAHRLAAQNAPGTVDPGVDHAPPPAAATDPALPAPGSSDLPASARASRIGQDDGETTIARLREGTRLTDLLGQFRQEGDLFSFVDEEGRTFGCLPNLGLERIANVLKGAEEPDSVWWSVSGTVTEFNERNYLLISRAVYKAAALPPTPDRVE